MKGAYWGKEKTQILQKIANFFLFFLSKCHIMQRSIILVDDDGIKCDFQKKMKGSAKGEE